MECIWPQFTISEPTQSQPLHFTHDPVQTPSSPSKPINRSCSVFTSSSSPLIVKMVRPLELLSPPSCPPPASLLPKATLQRQELMNSKIVLAPLLLPRQLPRRTFRASQLPNTPRRTQDRDPSARSSRPERQACQCSSVIYESGGCGRKQQHDVEAVYGREPGT
jgi:hypothetical protein